MARKLFQQFSVYEDALLEKYEGHGLFKEIGSFDDEKFINVLTQYGEGISANFVKFVEAALRSVRDESAQEAMVHILRDEIPATGPTHQQMRSIAMEKIGVTREKLASIKLTSQTQKTVDTYFDTISNPKWGNHDLGITAFVRVVGESLVGVVYRIFTQEIMRRFKVTENDVEFYSFHWHHDEKGGDPVEGGEIGHTEYYDIAMQNLLKTEEDLVEAKSAADLALKIREDFQNQFI